MEKFLPFVFPLLLLLLLLWFIISIGVIAFLLYRYDSFKDKIQEKYEARREEEIERIRDEQLDIARREMKVQFEEWKGKYEESIRQDAIQKSQAVTLGKVTEHFVPYLPEFTYNPKDARFLGTPVDFVVFDGLDNGEVKNIIFVEIKTGTSRLNKREKQIKEAAKAGRILWAELRPSFELSPINTG
jgi:predicted Holliday junction resolvase-like endonuclease